MSLDEYHGRHWYLHVCAVIKCRKRAVRWKDMVSNVNTDDQRDRGSKLVGVLHNCYGTGPKNMEYR